ncbi:hypothetical protein FK268_12755 [Tsukamurella sputi]|uniref:Uncharacterized protein n=1 Tax=Tsukamurella sputi TaxID=2591848 RepID=A0A5C5RL43_9ACTN|nr:hypothetical protein [Tsukamurella sputi]TWS23183.1 hypothetical protein FK268_12755 [Tsukamurella sputi]
MTTVVGLDLSLTGTGVAVITPLGAEVHRIASTGRRGATLAERHARLIRLRNATLKHVVVNDADLVLVEGPAYGIRAQEGRHDMAGYWWLVMAALQHTGRTVVEVPPTTRAKWATDKGNAPKAAVVAAVAKLWPDVTLVSDDCADALALASIGAIHMRMDVPFRVLERHREAAAKLDLPERPPR